MKVENRIRPEPEQVRRFLAVDGPVMMVNLLRFRDKAAYPDGRDSEISGAEAYARYAVQMKKLVEASGGRFVFGADVAELLLGEVEELWDQVAIVEYPSARTLIEISSSPEYRAIEVDREAGLAGQLNLASKEIDWDRIGS